MSAIGEAIKGNEAFSRGFKAGDARPHAAKLAVVACMDARMDIFRILGLHAGECYVIRNAGGIADESAIRSLLVAQHLLGVEEFMFIHHTDCGMLKFKEEAFAAALRKKSGTAAVAPARFYAFSSVEDDLTEQIEKVKSHPWTPSGIPVRGFIYDVTTGRLREHTPAAAREKKTERR